MKAEALASAQLGERLAAFACQAAMKAEALASAQTSLDALLLPEDGPQ